MPQPLRDNVIVHSTDIFHDIVIQSVILVLVENRPTTFFSPNMKINWLLKMNSLELEHHNIEVTW